MPLLTVSAILTRFGLGPALGARAARTRQRYEQEAGPDRPARTPGQRRNSGGGLHRRAFKLGWEFVQVTIDDATRLAYAEVLVDEKGTTGAGFLSRA